MDLRRLLEAYDARLRWCQPIRGLLEILAGYDAPEPSRVGLGDLTWEPVDAEERCRAAVTLLHDKPGRFYFSIYDRRAGTRHRGYHREAADVIELPVVIPEFLAALRATLGNELRTALPPPAGTRVRRFVCGDTLHDTIPVIEIVGVITEKDATQFIRIDDGLRPNEVAWPLTYDTFDNALEAAIESYRARAKNDYAHVLSARRGVK